MTAQTNGDELEREPEEFLPITGYEDSYEIGNQGTVRSKDRRVVRSNGTVQNFKGKVMSPGKGSHGYYTVFLNNSGKARSFCVHRLVADAFIAPRKGKLQVNHIDGNKLNNSLNNLEWVDTKENLRHAVQTGLVKTGRGHHSYRNSIVSTNLETGEEITFSGMNQIRAGGFCHCCAYKVANGKKKNHKGHTFRWATDEDMECSKQDEA